MRCPNFYEKDLVGERLQDGGFTGVVKTKHQDAQLLFFVLSQVAQDADQTASLS